MVVRTLGFLTTNRNSCVCVHIHSLLWGSHSFGLTTLTTVGLGDIAPITPQGRLVVCGSILLGVTIIPAQTAKLVDIFVESQKDQQRRKLVATTKRNAAHSRNANGSIVSSRSATNGLGPSGVAIEVPLREDGPRDTMFGTTIELLPRLCKNCRATPHRSDATFCWSCGAPLPLAQLASSVSRLMDDEVDEDETSLS